MCTIFCTITLFSTTSNCAKNYECTYGLSRPKWGLLKTHETFPCRFKLVLGSFCVFPHMSLHLFWFEPLQCAKQQNKSITFFPSISGNFLLYHCYFQDIRILLQCSQIKRFWTKGFVLFLQPLYKSLSGLLLSSMSVDLGQRSKSERKKVSFLWCHSRLVKNHCLVVAWTI